MGNRNIVNQAFITAQSMAASFNSSPFRLALAKKFNIQLSFTDTAAGTFKLQSSSDVTNNPALVTNWNDVPDSSQVISAPGLHQWTVGDPYKWIRVVYTRTGGDGLCEGVVFAVEEY